jgi:hypothetical protein
MKDRELLELAAKAAGQEPDDIAAAMGAVADEFAHKLALDLECILAEYSGRWYATAIDTLGKYRAAMREIHETISPTFMGEPLIVAPQPAQEPNHTALLEQALDALTLAAAINPYGSVENATARDHACAAITAIKEALK